MARGGREAVRGIPAAVIWVVSSIVGCLLSVLGLLTIIHVSKYYDVNDTAVILWIVVGTLAFIFGILQMLVGSLAVLLILTIVALRKGSLLLLLISMMRTHIVISIVSAILLLVDIIIGAALDYDYCYNYYFAIYDFIGNRGPPNRGSCHYYGPPGGHLAMVIADLVFAIAIIVTCFVLGRKH